MSVFVNRCIYQPCLIQFISRGCISFAGFIHWTICSVTFTEINHYLFSILSSIKNNKQVFTIAKKSIIFLHLYIKSSIIVGITPTQRSFLRSTPGLFLSTAVHLCSYHKSPGSFCLHTGPISVCVSPLVIAMMEDYSCVKKEGHTFWRWCPLRGKGVVLIHYFICF